MSSIKAIALAKVVGGGGGGGDTEIIALNVNQNGTYNPGSGKAYKPVNVNVPNSYAAGDEGKVVQNGALVSQTSRTVTANGTVDTTTNDEVVVAVQPNLQQKTATENGMVIADQGYDGLSSVTVNVSGGGDVEPALPSEYQRVEYLDFTPLIGIVITLPSSGKILFTADFTSDLAASNTNYSTVFGYRASSTTGKDFVLGVYTGKTYGYIRNPGDANGIVISIGENYTTGDRIKASILLVNPRTMALIGKYAYDYSSSGVDTYGLDGKFYSLKGEDLNTGQTVAWFVPCYRKSDNQVGVYDYIAQAFYYETDAAGSGYSIVAGPDVT